MRADGTDPCVGIGLFGVMDASVLVIKSFRIGKDRSMHKSTWSGAKIERWSCLPACGRGPLAWQHHTLPIGAAPGRLWGLPEAGCRRSTLSLCSLLLVDRHRHCYCCCLPGSSALRFWTTSTAQGLRWPGIITAPAAAAWSAERRGARAEGGWAPAARGARPVRL